MTSEIVYEKEVPGQWTKFTMKDLVDIPGIEVTDEVDIRRYPSSQLGGEYTSAKTLLKVTRGLKGIEEVKSKKDLSVGDFVYHDEIYGGDQEMKVTKIVGDYVELEGDYSGGTHGTVGKSFFLKDGLRHNK